MKLKSLIDVHLSCLQSRSAAGDYKEETNKRSTEKDLKHFEDSRQKFTSPQKLKQRHTRNLNTNQFEFKLGEDCWDTISEVLVKRSQPVL